MTTVIARTVTRLSVPLIILTAIALLVQGHNLPGGGFIAGVLTVTAAALVYVVSGLDRLSDLIGSSTGGSFNHGPVAWYRIVLAGGLALAVIAGLVPIVFGEAFLTQTFRIYHLPLFDEFELASAFVFDLGVYFTVVGALLSIIGTVGSE